MNIKTRASETRNGLQQGIYFVINPFVRFLIAIGVTPNVVTTIGLLGNIAAAVVFVLAAVKAAAGTVDYSLVVWAGGLIIGFSLFDMLDGQVARLGNMTTRFGAMYDSVLDRYCEIFTLGGIAYYLAGCGDLTGSILTFLALTGSVMVSYVRARAEGLGLECKIGFMQRPERVVVTSLAALATGITGLNIAQDSTFDPNVILDVAMGIIALFGNMTAFARINYCRRQLQAKK